MVKTGIRIAAVLLLVLPLLASDASAQKGGRGGGGGGGGAGFGRGGGGGGVGMRSFSAPRTISAPRTFSAPRVGGAGVGRFGGPGRPSIGSRPTIGGTGFARRSPGAGTVTGRTFTPASARIVGASPRTFAATRGFTRPGIIRANTVLGSRAITNRALRASIAPTLYRGRFRASYWPWWYGGIAIGWVGPVFWPYAYYDFFDYVFWPYVYDDFWPYAYDDVYFGIYGPYAYSGPGVRIARGDARGDTTSVQSAARRTATICSDQATGLTDLPIERISQTVRATDEQRALLDELKAATAKAVEILRAACPTELPSIAPGRLTAMQSRLEAMLQAVQTVRPALDKFYAALSDEQKARFNAVAPADKAAAAGKDQRDLTRLCGERAPGIADLPIERIAQAVQPTAAQQALLDQLKESSASAADRLKADCPTYQALTPTGRADVMEKRLGTILEAMKIVGPALSNFYDALSDEQKARFNTIESKLPQQG